MHALVCQWEEISAGKVVYLDIRFLGYNGSVYMDLV